jgi:hypothetical protein
VPHSLAFFATFDLSTLIALGALVLAALSYRRAGAADRRDRQRHELALADAADRRRADLVLAPDETTYASEDELARPVDVRNIGQATARRVRAWLVDAEGATRSTVAGDDGNVAIALGDNPVTLEAYVASTTVDLDTLRWCVAWDDDDGPHEDVTNARPEVLPDPMQIW